MWQGERFGIKLISLNTCLWGQTEQMNPCQKYVTKPKPLQYSKKVFPLHPVKGLLRVQRDNSFCSQGGTGGVDHISILANIWKRVATTDGLLCERISSNEWLFNKNESTWFPISVLSHSSCSFSETWLPDPPTSHWVADADYPNLRVAPLSINNLLYLYTIIYSAHIVKKEKRDQTKSINKMANNIIYPWFASGSPVLTVQLQKARLDW